MWPYKLDRDTKIADFRSAALESAFASTAQGHGSHVIYVKNDGLLVDNSASMRVASSFSVVGGNHVGVGRAIRHKEVIDDQVTTYTYSCAVYTEDANMMPFFFVAIAPDPPTNAAAGDSCERMHVIATGTQGSNFTSLTTEGIIACYNPESQLGGGYADRHLMFGIGISASGTTGTSQVVGRMHVRRNVALEQPVVLDSSKY